MNNNNSNNNNINQVDNNRAIRKSFGFLGVFIIINGFINIALTLINLGFGNIYCIILEILNATLGVIIYFKGARETSILISNIIFIVVTCIILLAYHHEKIFS